MKVANHAYVVCNCASCEWACIFTPSYSGQRLTRHPQSDVDRIRHSIKVLPDQRGYVCAGDDGALSAVASFEADIRSATLHLTGHSGFVTDCDVAETGHCILSSR